MKSPEKWPVTGFRKASPSSLLPQPPKPKTLEIFVVKGSDGLPHAFHVYSMRQAIEGKFIFDLLANYTTYQTYFQVGKKISDAPVYGKNKANKALGKFSSLHPHNLAQKTEIT